MQNKLIKLSCIALMISAIPLISSAATINSGTAASNLSTSSTTDMVPTGKGWGVPSATPPSRLTSTNVPQHGIYYHNGRVMGATADTIPNIYFVWYGNWAGNTAPNILSNLARGIATSPYYRTNATYTDAAGNPIIMKTNFSTKGCNAFDNYSRGTALSESGIYYIIRDAITAKKLPLDANGVYFVMTSPDVTMPGFCTQYCGWHTAASLSGIRLIYSFVGDPSTQCPNGCLGQPNKGISPNNNPGADGMASIWAHEIEEMETDPVFNAWYDNSGWENADKCAWRFGTTQTATNGSKYNMTINKMNYLIQQNWVNANNGYCASSYP